MFKRCVYYAITGFYGIAYVWLYSAYDGNQGNFTAIVLTLGQIAFNVSSLLFFGEIILAIFTGKLRKD